MRGINMMAVIIVMMLLLLMMIMMITQANIITVISVILFYGYVTLIKTTCTTSAKVKFVHVGWS
jgi:hypothetical protein